MTQDKISISAARYIEVVYDIKLDHLQPNDLMSQAKKMAVSRGDKTLADYCFEYKAATKH